MSIVQTAAPNIFRVVSPDDTNDLPYYAMVGPNGGLTDSLYVGTGGDVTVTLADGISTQTFSAVPTGTILKLSARRVKATGTTALNLVAQYVG